MTIELLHFVFHCALRHATIAPDAQIGANMCIVAAEIL